MERTSARLVAACALLLALWIGVYWLWTPSRPQTEAGQVGFAGSDPSSSEPSTSEPGDAATRPQQAEAPIEQQPEPANTPATTAPRFNEYTAKKGDTFVSIAEATYGSAEYWRVISRANPLKDPRRVGEGDVLQLPVDPANIQGVATDSPDTAPPPPEPEFIDYLVRSGDTLGGISLQFYGSTRYADLILAANRDQLASADKLRVGQTIRVPANPPD